LLMPVLIAALLTAAFVSILHRFRLWTIGELKDTIVWFFFTGVALIFRAVSAPNPARIIHAILWDALRITVLMEFLLNTYTFPLLVELLLLPLATVVAMLLAVADAEKKFQPVVSFLGKLQSILGGAIIVFTLWSVAHNLRGLWSIENARSLLLPVLLAIAFVPLAYFMAMISAYEQLFLPLTIHRIPFLLRSYAKMRLVARLGLSLSRTNIARRRLWSKLGRISNRADVDREVSMLTTEIPAPLPPGVDGTAYNAGYSFGLESALTRGDARMAVHEACDTAIAEKGYDLESFNQGFSAGTEDADFQV
jgi:hypothetical protein